LATNRTSLLSTLCRNAQKALIVKTFYIELYGFHEYIHLILIELVKALENMRNLVDLGIVQRDGKLDLSEGRTSRVIRFVSNPPLEERLTHGRAGYFQLHILCLDYYHDLDEIVADQLQLQFLGIHHSYYNAPLVWDKVKRLLYSDKLHCRTSFRPVVFMRNGYQITLFPAFYLPEEALPVFRKISVPSMGDIAAYHVEYRLSFSLLGISEDNINLLSEAICGWDDSRPRINNVNYTSLGFIVHETTVQVLIPKSFPSISTHTRYRGHGCFQNLPNPYCSLKSCSAYSSIFPISKIPWRCVHCSQISTALLNSPRSSRTATGLV